MYHEKLQKKPKMEIEQKEVLGLKKQIDGLQLTSSSSRTLDILNCFCKAASQKYAVNWICFLLLFLVQKVFVIGSNKSVC